MKKYLFVGSVLAVLFVVMAHQEEDAPPVVIDTPPEEQLLYLPGDIGWQPGPGSFEEGAEFAVLEGNPGEPGLFTLRIRMPDGFRISPHWHPNVERVTVLSGTFRMGHGDEFDAEGGDPLGPGSYFSMPPEMTHYAVTEGETVVQLTSIGPWIIHYVNPEDDPRDR